MKDIQANNNGKYLIGKKEYSRGELIIIGKEQHPKLFYIARYFGAVLFFNCLFVEIILGIITIVFANVMDETFPIWAFYIPLGIFGILVLVGLLVFILSFLGRSEEKYFRYGYNYVLRKTDYGANDTVVETDMEKNDQKKLRGYKKLVEAGMMTEEEFQKKRDELTFK